MRILKLVYLDLSACWMLRYSRRCALYVWTIVYVFEVFLVRLGVSAIADRQLNLYCGY